MNLISLSIHRPIAVVSVVIMVLLFGYVALQRIPIQMAPDVRQPVIIVDTNWAGAAPAEVEREIINRQEEELKGLEGVKHMESRSLPGRGELTLEFSPGANMDLALLLVANRLDRVSGYPDEAKQPTLKTSGTDDNAVGWFLLTREPGNNREMATYGDFLDDVVRDRIERIEGVSAVNIFGDTKREMRVIIDPERLARYSLTVSDVVTRLRAENSAITAGDIDEGKRRYVVRTQGDFTKPADVAGVVLRSSESSDGGVSRVTVGDIATVELDYKEPGAIVHQRDEQAMAFNLTREQGANVLEVMREVRKVVADLAEGALKNVGLRVQNVYDETIYINSAISLVLQNIYLGGALAAAILLLFLRSWRPTLIISLAIPVSVVGSFVAMAALGRSLNVISLAGIAFAVGMVVDAAIVVLENIFRLRQTGMPRAEAAYKGAAQVWPAVLVSALTTVMVFIPILIMELEAGQLFRDIAVAISVSVMLSLLVSITLIPGLANRLLSDRDDGGKMARLPVVDGFARGFVGFWLAFTHLVVRSKLSALLVVGAIVAAAAVFTWSFAPKLDYLPNGNRNLIIGLLIPPAGYNLQTIEDLTQRIGEKLRPQWASVSGPESVPGQPPKIDRFMRIAREGLPIIGATSIEESRAGELKDLIREAAAAEPGIIPRIFQLPLFGRSLGSTRTIDVDISGPDLDTIYAVGQNVYFRLNQLLPRSQGHQTRPLPSLTLGAPEVRVVPNRVKLADNGLSATDLGQSVDAFNDGLRVAEITVEGKRIDLTLAGPRHQITRTQGIGSLPVVTRGGRIVPVRSVADVSVTSGPTEIRRSERARTVTMQVAPSDDMPLQAAIEIIRDRVVAPMEAEGLPAGVQFHISGTADKLSETWNEMVLDLVLALVIVYLVMAILFESFIYPFIIMLSVPIAAAGGIAGLALVNVYAKQPLDMLTMLGFIILIGIVVNNAILLVHQTLYHIREDGMLPDAAITEATRNRIRPIFMSTLTSVFGMLPLVVFPGAGSELYRGLGAVVLGGLSLSAVLTLAIVPPMMSISVGLLERGSKAPAGRAAPEPGAAD